MLTSTPSACPFDLPVDALTSSLGSPAQSSLAGLDTGALLSNRLVAPSVQDRVGIDVERTGGGVGDVLDGFRGRPHETPGFYRAGAGLVPRVLNDLVTAGLLVSLAGGFWDDERGVRPTCGGFERAAGVVSVRGPQNTGIHDTRKVH